MQAEFEQLYTLLHLNPDCTLEEFQHAYRRAIAELHPDRWQADARTAEQQSQLRELISLHSLATRFYVRHGRLPGARPSHLALRIPAKLQAPVIDEQPSPRGGASNRRWLILAALLAFLVWQLAGQSVTPPPEEQEFPGATLLGESSPGNHALTLGMDANTVLAIQGEPEHRGATEWRYGSSWLRFKDDRLVDWYSSPFHRLNTATSSPPTE